MKLKPLFLEYDYLSPKAASSQITRTFWGSIDEKKCSPTILCSKSENTIETNYSIVTAKDSKFFLFLGRIFRKLSLPDLAYNPDMYYYSWGLNAKKKALECIKKGDVNYIQSLSWPLGTQKIALELKKETGLPWVAQFFDPFYEFPENIYRTKYFKNKLLELEKEIAINADLIIHNNDVIAEIWRKRYGNLVAKKIIVIPLNYNQPRLPLIKEKKKNNSRIVLSHIGGLYGSRSIRDIIEALQQFKSEGVDIGKINIQLIGGINKPDLELINKYKLNDMFEIVGRLAPEQLDEYYQKADVFLAIDMNMVSSPFFPSKLMMYYYYRKPILGITTIGSVTDREMQLSGHKCINYGNIEETKNYILNILNNGVTSLDNYDKDYWLKFQVETVINKYISELSNLIE